MHKLDFCYILHFIKHNTFYFLKIELSHHIYGKFCHYTFMERNVFDLLWCCLQPLYLTWYYVMWHCLVCKSNEMWLCLVCKIYCKTNCKPGGTLGIHGRNPSEGSAWSARPAEGLAINIKPQVEFWLITLHHILHTHIHSFI